MLDDAAGTPFAAGLRRALGLASLGPDMAAVQAALDLSWTTNPAESQINRLKMLKRTMYGRAGFDLLRARVLHAVRYRNNSTGVRENLNDLLSDNHAPRIGCSETGSG